MHESCGVFGVYSHNEDVARLTFFALFALQHRGQESSGIATADGKRLRIYTGMGRVSSVFTEDALRPLTGHIAIGHNRYSTAGSSRAVNAQPFIVGNDRSTIGVAHNGNIVNALRLYEELVAMGYKFRSTSDSEVIANLILATPGKNWVEKIRSAMRRLQGAYSLVVITPQELYIPDKTKSYNQKFFTLASQFIQIISALVYRTLLIQKLLCPYSRFAPGNLLYDVNVSCSLSPCFKCMRYPAQTTEKDGLKARKACKRYCSLK